MRIGVGQYAMMYSVAARPLITGRIMSSVTTSGRSFWHISIAVFPSAASPATCSSESALSTSTRRLRTVNESSTTRIRIFCMASVHQLLDGFEEMLLVELAFDDVGARPGLPAAPLIVGRVARGDENGWNLPQQRI